MDGGVSRFQLVMGHHCRQYPEGMHVVVNGFVNNMAEWMSACDTIVTKAGPGTIAESLICGLPLLLNGFVPCQESGNVPFVVENKVPSSRMRMTRSPSCTLGQRAVMSFQRRHHACRKVLLVIGSG